jgi:hypothetical protein
MKSSKKKQSATQIFSQKKKYDILLFLLLKHRNIYQESVITSFKNHYIDIGIFKSYTSIEVVNIASNLKCYHFVINFSSLSRG